MHVYKRNKERTSRIGDVKMKKDLKNKVVVIKWKDITKKTNADSETNTFVNIDLLLANLVTVGVVWKESKSSILLAQEFWMYNGELMVRDWVVIPKSVIKEIIITGEIEECKE